MKYLLFLLFAPFTLMAAPFLVCDQPPTGSDLPVSYAIAISGAATVNATSPALNAVYGFQYDLVALGPGTYTAVVSGIDAKGIPGPGSSFSFSLPLVTPAAPTNLRVVP